jgi:serine/threonine protein kinase
MEFVAYNEATQPQNFPTALVHSAQVKRVSIRVQGGVEVRRVIHSQSGTYYEVGGLLKKAIFGQVVRAVVLAPDAKEGNVWVRSDQHRAIKIYSKALVRQMRGSTVENPLMEIPALQFIGDDHPNIMGQIECCTDDDNIYSVMRYCPGGELFDRIEIEGCLDNDTAKVMFRQLLSGMERLHSLGIAHRDMSLENMLYDSDADTYVIIDFGMCLRMKSSEGGEGFRPVVRQRGCGKRNYMSPEILRFDPEPTFDPTLCDIWAAGVILFIALTGTPPVEAAVRADFDDLRGQIGGDAGQLGAQS